MSPIDASIIYIKTKKLNHIAVVSSFMPYAIEQKTYPAPDGTIICVINSPGDVSVQHLGETRRQLFLCQPLRNH